ncbi:MAG: sodium:solute symporter family transporter [Planctomycetota bacterium]|jgi:SSS family transporter
MDLELQTVDALVLLVYLAGAVALGGWIGRRTDADEYLAGGRDLPWWVVLGSIVATETSTATFLSVPGLAYAAGGDLRFLQLAVGFLLGRVLVSLWLLPKFFDGKLTSAYQVIERRFGAGTQRWAAFTFLVTRNLGDGLRLFLAALVLAPLVGIDLWQAAVVVGAVTVGYTWMGGLRSVVVNDCIQLVIYMVGGLAVGAVVLWRLPGGWEQFQSFAEAQGKLRLLGEAWNPSDTYALTTGVVGGLVLTLGTHGTDQLMVQRYLAAKSLSHARAALTVSGVVVLLQFTLFLLLGAGLAAFYAEFPRETAFERNDAVLGTFVIEQLPGGYGLIGLILAGVFAAAMSTLSSSLNSSATVVVSDLLPDADESRVVARTRSWTLFFGLLQTAFAIAAVELSQSVVSDALALAGFSAGLLLGLFALGSFLSSAGGRHAQLGLLAGLLALLAVHFGTDLAWPWYATVGSATVFAVGALSTLLLPLTQEA